VVAVAMVIAVLLLLFGSRKSAIGAFLAAGILIGMGQGIVLGPFHFLMQRVLILFGCVRVLRQRSSFEDGVFGGRMKGLDTAFVLLTLVSAIATVLLWQTMAAVINQLGLIITMLGAFVVLRFLIRDEEDVETAIRALAYIAAVLAVAMVVEELTGKNLYGYIGGRLIPDMRGGRYRAMAGFSHEILAGTFGAIVLPLFVWLWWKGKKVLGLVGVVSSLVIVFTSNSSTSLMGLGGALIGLAMWPLRKQMRLVRWGIVGMVVSLHMVMKAPVWALIGRFDMGGSSGFHRYQLVDQCIRHFGDWWLVGVKDYPSWGWDMWDLANQYVGIADTTGLLPLIFFIAIIVYGFKYIGRARKAVEGDKQREKLYWALGATMFANVVAFFGISYFDQTQNAWYATLAIICASTGPFLAKTAEAGLQPAYPVVPATTREGALAKDRKGPSRWPLGSERIR
jgi:hypothetical protein